MIGTRPEIDADGKYTGKIEFYAYGPGKAQAIRELAARDGISLPNSFAYSDSATDLPMMETVGHPVAVNPDRELQRDRHRPRLADSRVRTARDFAGENQPSQIDSADLRCGGGYRGGDRVDGVGAQVEAKPELSSSGRGAGRG